ncbi:MAG: glycosyltransferase [Candidatus Limnocylindrales bacterium]
MSEGALDRVDAGDRLKIAFLGDPSSIHLRRWVNYFADRGHDVTLLVPRDWPVDPAQMPAVAIERFTRFAARGRFAPASYLRARRSLRSALARVRPDVLNAHYLTSNGWHAWISGFHPYAVTLWGSDIFLTPRESRAFANYARLTLRAADMVMVNSAALQRGAIDLGAAPGRTEMVQWGVDLTRFSPGPDPTALRARLGLEGRRVVFSPRGLAPLYRHGVVIEALSRLPSDVVVVMTMQHCVAEELEAVRRKIDELGLVDRVVILPEIGHDDMPDFYRMSEVMVTVPASDSTSVAILESLASGLQIVAGDLPSVREWLYALDPSALVPIDDPVATAAALARALDRDPAERARLGREGRAIVEARADQARSLARVESLYRQLAVGNRVRAPR